MLVFVKHECAYLFETANVLELWELNLLQECFLVENAIVVVWLMCGAKGPFVKHLWAYLFKTAYVLGLWELNLVQVCFLIERAVSVAVAQLMC